MTKTVVVEKGFYKLSCWGYQRNNVEIPVCYNTANDKVGVAKVFYDENLHIKATLNLTKEVDGYPAIAFRVFEKQNEVVTSFQLVALMICDVPNIDPSIKKISEQ